MGAPPTGAVLMTSGNIGVTNADKDGQLLVSVGTFTMNGGFLSADQIVVTNPAISQFSLNGGVVTSSFTKWRTAAPSTSAATPRRPPWR